MKKDLEIDCPECSGKARFDLEDVAKGRTVRCTNGHQIKLTDKGGGAAKITKSLKDFEKQIKRLGS